LGSSLRAYGGACADPVDEGRLNWESKPLTPLPRRWDKDTDFCPVDGADGKDAAQTRGGARRENINRQKTIKVVMVMNFHEVMTR